MSGVKLVLVAATLGCVAVALYLGCIGNEFVWDDPIVFDRQLPYFDSLRNAFFPPPGIPQFGDHYYRPLGVVSYMIDEKIVSTFWPLANHEAGRRTVYHASPILYHVVCTELVFVLGLVLLGTAGPLDRSGVIASAAATLLFAVHPIHVESVAWMAGRFDVLCGICVTLALVAYVRYRQRGTPLLLAASMVALLAGVLFKEAALGFLLLIPLVNALVPRAGALDTPAPVASRAERRRRDRAAKAAPPKNAPGPLAARAAYLPWVGSALVLVVYFMLRRAGIDTVSSPSMHQAPRLERLPGTIGWYIVKAFWPPPQSSYVPTVPGGAYALIGVLVPLGFLVALVVFGRRRRYVPELLAGGLFFASLAVSLIIALFPISKTPLAERYLYLPTAGSLLLVFFLLRRGTERIRALPPAWRAAVPAILAVLVAFPAGAAALARQRTWSNNLEFWSDAAAKAPTNGVPHLHLGMTYGDAGRDADAEREYKLALQYYDNAGGRAKTLNDLGSLYLKNSRFDDAIEEFKKAIAEDGNYETPHYNWALCLLNKAASEKNPQPNQQMVRQAIAHFERALQITPRYVKAHFQYGALLVRLGDVRNGRAHLEKVIELAPASEQANDARKILGRTARAPAAS